MKKFLIKNNEEENYNLIRVSKIDYDNLKLLKQYLPKDLSKKEFTEQEIEYIKKYNNFIDSIQQKSKNNNIIIDFVLEKIVLDV